MKLIVGMVNHETNTFNTVRTEKETFERICWSEGENAIRTSTGGSGDYLGGIIAGAREQGVEIAPTLACVQASGIISSACREEIWRAFFDAVRENRDADGVCLAMHGAGVCENDDDLEGSLLEELRALMGDKPIFTTYDLHANISDKMVENADALFSIREYPHTDCFEIGKKAVELLIRQLRGEIKVEKSFIRLPLNIPPALGATNLEVPGEIRDHCRELETGPVLHVSFFHGFPNADVPFMASSVLVHTDGDGQLAKSTASEVAEYIWSRREAFLEEPLDEYQAIDAAMSLDGMVVINDTSDNPGGGGPGDGTHLLRALLERNEPRSCFGFIFDKEVASAAHAAGVGSSIDIRLGGKTAQLNGAPIDIKGAYVKCLTDGRFYLRTPMYKGAEMPLGPSCRLQVGNVDIIVTSFPFQTLDEEVFILHGIDVREYKLVCLKGSQHFKARFSALTDNFVTADTRGITSSRLGGYPYSKRKLDFYPVNREAVLCND